MGVNRMEITPEKAQVKFPASEFETRNRRIIKTLYKALARGEIETAAQLVASDLEWWFHGPVHCNHMMRILTGDNSLLSSSSRHTGHFKFRPRSIKAVGDRVVVEGWEGQKAYWVHVWTVGHDETEGVITQFREYFNTWLTVILRVTEDGDAIRLWESEPRERMNRSLPDLVLAV